MAGAIHDSARRRWAHATGRNTFAVRAAARNVWRAGYFYPKNARNHPANQKRTGNLSGPGHLIF